MRGAIRRGGIWVWPLAVFLLAGCGSKIYNPPASGNAGIIIIENRIHPPGFSVSIDKKRADYLKRKIRIPVAPGEHTVRLYNRSTTLKNSMTLKEERTFKYKVEVGAGEVRKIILSWDDPAYKFKGGKWKALEAKGESGAAGREAYPYFPGLPTGTDTPQSSGY